MLSPDICLYSIHCSFSKVRLHSPVSYKLPLICPQLSASVLSFLFQTGGGDASRLRAAEMNGSDQPFSRLGQLWPGGQGHKLLGAEHPSGLGMQQLLQETGGSGEQRACQFAVKANDIFTELEGLEIISSLMISLVRLVPRKSDLKQQSKKKRN